MSPARRRLRLVYYTYPAVLAPALSLTHELSKHAECHLLLEVSPSAWKIEMFDVDPRSVPSGIVEADPILSRAFPAGLRKWWCGLASFKLVVHPASKSLHPASWRLSRAVTRSVRELAPDLVHFDDVSRRMVLALPSLGRIPVVLSLHDPTFHSGEGSWRGDLFRRLMLRRANHVILHNDLLKLVFCRRYRLSPTRVHSVHLGVYDLLREWVCEPIVEEDRTVLMFGRLSPYKGLDVLYRAAPRIAERVPGVRFVVAGQPVPGYVPPPPPRLPNDGQIEVLTEYISNTKLARLFQRATVIACPYRDATQSGVALTGYAFGKPIVATRTGGLPEYVRDGETGLLVAPGDAEALGDALVRVLLDPQLKAGLQAGITSLRRDSLTWERAARQTLDAYDEVVGLLMSEEVGRQSNVAYSARN